MPLQRNTDEHWPVASGTGNSPGFVRTVPYLSVTVATFSITQNQTTYWVAFAVVYFRIT